MRTFLETEKHLTPDELYHLVKRKNPSIETATVYSTFKLLCECGLSRELKLKDGSARYEHFYRHERYDRPICLKCRIFIEANDDRIDKLQNKLAEANGFIPHTDGNKTEERWSGECKR